MIGNTNAIIGSGGGEDLSPSLIMRTISEYNDVGGKVKYVGSQAFTKCSLLTKVTFPECEKVSYYAFAECFSLTDLSFPKCKYLDQYVFYRCSSLIEVNFPECLSVNLSAFGSCSLLKSVNLSNCVKFTSGQVFDNCSSLSDVYIPYVTSMAQTGGFRSCINLSKIFLPALSVTGGAQGIFQNCIALKEVLLGNVASLTASMFSNCNSLESLYLCTCSKNLANTQYNAFSNTPMLDSSYLGYYGSIYVPSEIVSLVKASASWASLSDRITSLPESFKSQFIYGYEFSWSSTMSAISSDRLNAEYIGTAGFVSCYSLESAIFPECKTIAAYAFSACSSISTIYFPKVIFIGQQAFARCLSLTQASFPECRYIESNCFSDCTKLSEIFLPKCVCFGTSTFYDCYSLTQAILPQCESLSGWNFQRCTVLSLAVLPKCSEIGQTALAYCTSLSIVVVGTELQEVCSLGTGAVHPFHNTPIENSTYLGYYGSIYVPDSLVSDYKVATNWASLSDRITGISNLPSAINI